MSPAHPPAFVHRSCPPGPTTVLSHTCTRGLPSATPPRLAQQPDQQQSPSGTCTSLVVRGFGSQSYVDVVRARTARDPRPAVLLYVGDFDCSGADIERDWVARTSCWSKVERIVLYLRTDSGLRTSRGRGRTGRPPLAGLRATVRIRRRPARPVGGRSPRTGRAPAPGPRGGGVSHRPLPARPAARRRAAPAPAAGRLPAPVRRLGRSVRSGQACRRCPRRGLHPQLSAQLSAQADPKLRRRYYRRCEPPFRDLGRIAWSGPLGKPISYADTSFSAIVGGRGFLF